MKDPQQSVCPLAPPPILPTSSPTAIINSPTLTPITSLSEQPSATPTIIPTVVPTPSCPPIRRSVANDTSVIGREPLSSANMLKQKQNINQHLHHFYDPLQYDVGGRSVGTRSPVFPPSECPEINTPIPEERDDLPLQDRKTKPKLKKKTPAKLDQKEKLPLRKGGTISNKKSKVNKHDGDDDLSFVEIERPSTNASDAPAVVVVESNENDFGSISTPSPAPPMVLPSNAPTTTYERLETQFEMSRQDGWNGETAEHSMTKKGKSKMRNRI